MVLVCHIAGLNNFNKSDFLEFIKNINNENIVVRDLDEIFRDQDFDKITWKNTFSQKICNLERQHKNKKLILLGLCTYCHDLRLRIPINTNNKFFIDHDLSEYAKQIVEYNITKNIAQIINGYFPLKYLEHDYIIAEREKLANLYNYMGYKLKSLDSIKLWLELMLSDHNILNKNDFPYAIVASTVKYNKYIQRNFDKIKDIISNNNNCITGYSNKWLSLLSCVNTKNILQKGIRIDDNDTIVYIKELVPNGFDILKRSCYLYYVDPNIMIRDGYKYIYNDNHIKIIERHYINNILNELVKEGVELVVF